MSFGDDEFNDRMEPAKQEANFYQEPTFREGNQSFQESPAHDNSQEMRNQPLFKSNVNNPSNVAMTMPPGFSQSHQDLLNNSQFSLQDSPIDNDDREMLNFTPEESLEIYDCSQHQPSLTLQSNAARNRGNTEALSNEMGFKVQNINKGREQNSQLVSTVGRLKENEEFNSYSQGNLRRSKTMSARKLLFITIRSATKLKNREKVSKSDPFVRITITDPKSSLESVQDLKIKPDPLASAAKYECQTSFVNNQLEPTWNEKFTFLHFETDELENDKEKVKQVKFELFDWEDFGSHKIMGEIDMPLTDLLNRMKTQTNLQQADIPLRLKQRISGSQAAYRDAGILIVQVKTRHLSTEETAFERLEGQARQDKMKMPSNCDGVLKVTLHHFDQMEGAAKPASKYNIYANVVRATTDLTMNAKVAESKPLVSSFEKEDSFQVQQDFTFRIPSLLDSTVRFQVKKRLLYMGFKSTETFVADFSLSLQDAAELMQGGEKSIVIKAMETSVDSCRASRAFISLQYFNSFFTRHPEGKFKLQMTSSYFGQNPFATSQFITIRIGKETKPIVVSQANVEFELAVNDPLEPLIDLRVVDKSGFGLMQKELAAHSIHPYEVFKDQDQIVFQDVFQSFTFLDKNKANEVKVAFLARFQHARFTIDELKNLGQDEARKQKQRGQNYDALFRTPSTNVGANNQLGNMEALDNSQDKSPAVNGGQGEEEERDLEFVNLQLENLNPVLDMRRGVMSFRVTFAEFDWTYMASSQAYARSLLKEKLDFVNQMKARNEKKQGAKAGAEKAKDEDQEVLRAVLEQPSFYVIIKNSKVAAKSKTVKGPTNPQWFEILDLKVIDPKESFTIKLYLDNPIVPILVAEGVLQSSKIFQEVKCWQKFQVKSLLKVAGDKNGAEMALYLDCFYRNSHFTRLPRGKVEVTLQEGHSLKIDQSSFIKPLFVFTVRNQTYQLCKQVNPNNAKWQEGVFYFETSSVWDTLEIRIYQTAEDSKDQRLTLLGSLFVPLNSVYYDDMITQSKTLNLRDAHELLGGQIKLNFEYIPIRKGLDGELSTDNAQEQVDSDVALLKTGRGKRMNEESLTVNDKKRGVCFMTLKQVRVQNMAKNEDYSVENVRVQISYQKQKCLSRITTDLNKTGDREELNDQFRLVIDDISQGLNRYDQEKISVTAYDIDYRGNKEVSEIQLLIGQSCIEPCLLRMHPGMELHYQCAIPLENFYFQAQQKRPRKLGENQPLQKEMQDLNELKDMEKEVSEFLKMGKKGKEAEMLGFERKKQEKELLLTFHIVYLSTNFTKSPLGIITINELCLLNMQYFLKQSIIKEVGAIYAQFKLNGNKNNTSYARILNEEPLSRKGLCLFHQEYDPIDVMRSGDDYQVDHSQVPQVLSWDQQLVLFTSSPLDQLEIEIILDKTKLEQAGEGRRKTDFSSNKVILANILLNVADISYFMNRSPSNEASIATLMDFQNSTEDSESAGPSSQALALNINDSTLERKEGMNRIQMIKAQRFTSGRDLLSKAFQKQLIALMKIKYQSDVFIEKEQMKDKLSIDHLFLIPREVKYDDYINEGYERIKRQHLTQIKGSKPALTQPPGKREHSHMLVEFRLIHLSSILRDIATSNRGGQVFCFVAFEYLSKADSVSTYILNSTNYVRQEERSRFEKEKVEIQQKLNQGSNALDKEERQEMARKRLKQAHGFGQIVEDFVAPIEELLKLDTQITTIFNVNDFEVHTINEMLEGWVPINTNKIMLSLVVQQNSIEQLKLFRKKLLLTTLSQEATILGIQKAGENTEYANIEVYQTPIEFELYPSEVAQQGAVKGQQQLSKPVSTEPTILNTFIQSANLATLANQGNLLMNPITRAQCLVRTRLQTSAFIDTPSGYLNLALKKLSYNSTNFRTDAFVRVALKSRVSKEKLIEFSTNINDSIQTQLLSTYKFQKEERGNKKTVLINEVGNFLVRHFADTLILSIYQLPKTEPKGEAALRQQQPDLIFQTKVELNNLDLNEEKLTIMVVGTHIMKNRGSPVYYTFDIDLQFSRRLTTDKGNSSRDLALTNYKLLKGVDQLSTVDVQIVDKLLERSEMGKKLLPYRIRLRKVFFILRNMVKSSFQSLDLEQQTHLRVLPRLFFVDLKDPVITMSLSEEQKRELLNSIKKELLQGRVTQAPPPAPGQTQQQQQNYLNTDSKYKGLKLERGSQVEKANVLVIEFLSSIQVAHGGASGMATNRSRLELQQFNSKGVLLGDGLGQTNPMLNQSMASMRSVTGMSLAALNKYKKMMLHVLQGEETICKHSFDKLQLLTGNFLKGLRVFVKNVKASTVLTFRILVEEEKTSVGGGISNSKLGSGLSGQDTSKLTQLGFTVLDVGAQSLSTWVRQEKTIAISHFSVNVGLNLLFSDFTKNPHKVVHFTLHRLITLAPQDVVGRDGKPVKDKEFDFMASANASQKNLTFENLNKNQTTGAQQEGKYQNAVQGKNPRQTEHLNALLLADSHSYKFSLVNEPIVYKSQGKDPYNSTTQMFLGGTSSGLMQLNEEDNPQGNQGAGMQKTQSRLLQGFLANGQQAKVPQEGSVNQALEKIQSRVSFPELDVKLKLLVEFENCLEYQGAVKDSRNYELDQYGRRTVPAMDKVTINNTHCENRIVFKLCIDTSAGKQTTPNALNPSSSVVVIAQTSLHLAEVQSLPNQNLNFFIPIKSMAEQSALFSSAQFDDVSLKWALNNYALNNVHIMGSIKITDKTFGELSINMESLRGVPKSLELREVQYRVQVRPNNMQSKELMLQSIQQKQEAQKLQERERLKNFVKPGAEPKKPVTSMASVAQGAQGVAKTEAKKEDNKEEMKRRELEQKRREKKELTSTGAPQEQKGLDTYSFESPRMEYSINVSNYTLERTINIPLALKDIFSDVDSFLDFNAAELFKDYDNKLVFQLIGFDENNQQIELGQIELGMISMIQKQMMQESKQPNSNFFASKNPSLKTVGGQEQQRAQQYEQVAEKKLEREFQGASAKFQRLFKESYVRFSETKSLMQQRKDEQLLAKRKEFQDRLSRSPDGRLGATGEGSHRAVVEVPEGFQLFKFEKPKPSRNEFEEMMGMSISASPSKAASIFSAQKPQIQTVKAEGMSDLVVKIEWNFSYKAKAHHSDNFNEISEELKHLQRIKQKKDIRNILELLTEVKASSSLVYNNLKTLAQVLASESCMSYSTEEELLNCQALQVVESIISVLTALYKECQLRMETLILIMRSITYLKIICDCNAGYKKIFENSVRASLLIETMIETYETHILDSRSGYLTQTTAGIEFMNFLAAVLLDFSDVYFEMISGVRLEPLLKFMNELNKNDFRIVQAYAKFLNSVAQCLVTFDPEKQPEAVREKRTLLVKKDMKSISIVIDKALQHLVSGGLTVYKTDHEVITETLCKTAMQFVHLAVVQSRLVEAESFVLSDILLHLFKVLVDSIISKLYLDFITDLKQRLNYEISMIKSLDLTQALNLIFDDGELMGMMQSLTVYFAQLMKVFDVDKKIHGLKFFEKTKLIFEFFASENCMNAFAENMRAKALKADPKSGLPVRQTNILSEILTDPAVEDVDFVLFLQKVVKIDAEIESQADGEEGGGKVLSEAERRQRERERKNKFMTDKYGDIQRTNKFSLTRVGWLDTLYNNDL